MTDPDRGASAAPDWRPSPGDSGRLRDESAIAWLRNHYSDNSLFTSIDAVAKLSLQAYGAVHELHGDDPGGVPLTPGAALAGLANISSAKRLVEQARRELVYLALEGGVPAEEVAAVLDCTPGTVRALHRRVVREVAGLARLRAARDRSPNG